jgi:hypothetical protein
MDLWNPSPACNESSEYGEPQGLFQFGSAGRSVLGTWAGEKASDLLRAPGSTSVNTPFAEALSREFISPEWSSPMEALAALQSNCDRRIADAVGASEGSTQQSARLRLVLGDRFEDYRGQFETRRLQEAAARQAEIQRQADARAAREFQERVREPYRAPELRDRVEPRPRPRFIP